MTKREIRKLEAQARQARIWAGEEVAKAVWCAVDGDNDGFDRCMAEARRLALESADLLKQANAERRGSEPSR